MDQTDGGFLRFVMVSADIEGVNVTSIPVNPVRKEVEGAALVDYHILTGQYAIVQSADALILTAALSGAVDE